MTNISLDISPRRITAFIGPSGCGKSSLLRVFNRMNDTIAGTKTTGEVRVDGERINDPRIDVVELRRRIGMVFQRANPFPKTIFENVAFGPRIHGQRNKSILAETVEKSLRQAVLWNEVKDKLHQPASALSGGQQQRLCIARALAVEPEVLLMDEPTSALDPKSTLSIEALISQLKQELTVVIVTHNMQQAARVSDDAALLLSGELVEFGPTRQMFNVPRDRRTEDYINGRFG